LSKTIWPASLAAFYPHSGSRFDGISVILAGAVLAAISVFVARNGRARPYLPFGWLWYLVSLLPVLGIVQVGLQSMADRYTYVPLVGIFVMTAWGAADLVAAGLPRRSLREQRLLLGVVAALVLLIFLVVAHRQAGYWENGIMLFERTIAVTEANAVAQNNLGSAYYQRRDPGDLDRAVAHYQEAVRIHPRYHVALNNLAGSLMQLGRTDEAIERWRSALEVKPDYVSAGCNLAGALILKDSLDEAIAYCKRALSTDPSASCAHYNLGMAVLRQGRLDAAELEFRAALRTDPDSLDSRLNLGVVLVRQGRAAEACFQWAEVLRRDPGNAMAAANIERSRAASGTSAAGANAKPSATDRNP